MDLDAQTAVANLLDRLWPCTRPDELSSDLCRIADRALLDTVGCALAVRPGDDTGADAVVALARAAGGHPDASIWGRPYALPAPAAAWVNGTIAHTLDFDDYTLTSWIGHPSVVLWPAVAAIVGAARLSGRQAAAGVIAGWEFGARLGLAAGAPAYERGWHNTATIGAPAAAVAVARALGGPPDLARRALSIAASTVAAVRANFGSPVKPLHAGLAARAGLEAVLLARRGVQGQPDALLGPRGSLTLLAGDGGDLGGALASAGADVGLRWDCKTPGVGVKPWPTCAYSHWAIDAALTLRTQGVVAGDIVAIVLETAPLVPTVCRYPAPRDGLEARFSLEYLTALALLHGSVTWTALAQVSLAHDAPVRELAARAHYEHCSEFAANPWGGRLRLRLRSGAELALRVDTAPGSPARPLGDGQLRAKFTANAERAMGARCGELADALAAFSAAKPKEARRILKSLAVC